MDARLKVVEDVGCCIDGSSSPSDSSPSDSDGSSRSSVSDDCCFWPYPRPRASAAALAAVEDQQAAAGGLNLISSVSLSVLSDIDRHTQSMLLLLPAFESPSAAPRAQALSRWLAGFDVGWVLEIDTADSSLRSLRRREVCTRVSVWSQALSTMDAVFRLRQRKLRNDATAAAAALGELASETAGAMLRLAPAVAALESSPSALLAALDVYVPVSEMYPGLAWIFSWCASHPVPVAADSALAALVDAARRCVRGLPASIRTRHYYPWRMPQGGEVHPCVGFWMGYFRCMLRNRVSLYLLADEPTATPGGILAELISCLEDVLEEKSSALAFPGLRQVFMLNNTHAIVRRAVRSDLTLVLPPRWRRDREDRMEGYVKGYLDASWAPVVSCLDLQSSVKSNSPAVLRRRRRDPLGAFYSAMENACSAQRCWKVPSPVLRRVLRRTVSDHVVTAYGRYLDEAEQPAAARTVEEVERQLSELFEG